MTDVDHRAAISGLLCEYSDRIDGGDLDGVGALFAAATYRTVGSPIVLTGADEVAGAQHAVVRLYDGVPRTAHHLSNVRIDLAADGSSARARSRFAVHFAPPGEGPRVIITGRYDDRLALVDGQWRFTDREITIDHYGDLRGHLRTDLVGFGDPTA